MLADLGNLAGFSGTTLNSGIYQADTTYSDPSLGLTSTIKFNRADIRTNKAYIGLFGASSRIVDQNGHDALARFQHNELDGTLDFEQGYSFTSAGSIVNEGRIFLVTSYGGIEGPVLFTVRGDYTGIGYPINPGPHVLGAPDLVAAGPLYDARMIIEGKVTNYDASTRTLNKSYWIWEAANGVKAITQVRGGERPFDIVTSKAAVILFGPNTGFRDKFGNDALRNLSVSARLLIGDRNFTTCGSFTSTSRLSIFGDTRFTVSGHLTIRSGFFEVSPLTGYAREGFPDTPIDPAYLSSSVIIRGNLNLPPPSILRFHIFNEAKTATVNVKGAAIFAGSLQAGVEDVSKVHGDNSFTVLTADSISGQFSNVANGGRVNVYGDFDAFGNPLGDPIGTFRVAYNKDRLVLSDFHAK